MEQLATTACSAGAGQPPIREAGAPGGDARRPLVCRCCCSHCRVSSYFPLGRKPIRTRPCLGRQDGAMVYTVRAKNADGDSP